MSAQCGGQTLWHTYPLLHQCWLLTQRQVGFSLFQSEDWTDSDTRQSVMRLCNNVFFHLYSKTTVSTTETVTVKSSSDTTWVLSCCEFSELKLLWGLFTESRSAQLNNYWPSLWREMMTIYIWSRNHCCSRLHHRQRSCCAERWTLLVSLGFVAENSVVFQPLMLYSLKGGLQGYLQYVATLLRSYIMNSISTYRDMKAVWRLR